MANPTTIESSATLSNLVGSYDTSHWQTVVAPIKAGQGVLLRGSVLSAVAADAGALTLTIGTTEAAAYGVLLDASVDATSATTASVARAGSFRGAALIVGGATNETTLAAQLRLIGIYTEGPIKPVTLTSTEAKQPDEEREERKGRDRDHHKS